MKVENGDSACRCIRNHRQKEILQGDDMGEAEGLGGSLRNAGAQTSGGGSSVNEAAKEQLVSSEEIPWN